jgi:Domain of unknown function (DUF4145)
MQLLAEELSVISQQDVACSLWQLIGKNLSLLWKDWPKQMEVTNIGGDGFVLAGECPHCNHQAAFMSVGKPFEENHGGYPNRMVAAMCCVACKRYILAILAMGVGRSVGPKWIYETHYPLGMPNEHLDVSIPKDVAEDVKEAIRCQGVGAFRACVVMCRRALETSVTSMGASGANLQRRIDDLASKGTITDVLKQFAQEVRLTGNAGAHSDGLSDVKESDAADIMTFTSQYLMHVYVMPAKLKARRPAAKANTTT